MYNSIYGFAPAHLVNSIVMACETNSVNTRVKDTMKVDEPYCRTDIMKRSFIYRGSIVWNQLPSNVHCASSIESFKKHAKDIFRN